MKDESAVMAFERAMRDAYERGYAVGYEDGCEHERAAIRSRLRDYVESIMGAAKS